VALGADDPLLFGARLTDQYEQVRAAHGLANDDLGRLAAMSVRASSAPARTRDRLLGGIASWLTP